MRLSRWGLACAAALFVAVAAHAGESADKLSPWLRGQLEQQERASFLIVVDRPDLGTVTAVDDHEDLYRRLTESASATQAALRRWLASEGVVFRSFYLVNAIEVEGDLGLALRAAERPEVVRVVGNPAVRVHDPAGPGADGTPRTDGAEWGVEMVRAPQAWS
jgi:hypothetical protein